METTTLLITQIDVNFDSFKEMMPMLKLDKHVLNEPGSHVKVEGLRVSKVYFTPDVMITGMDVDLFSTLYNNLIRMSINPSDGFRLVR